MDMKREYKLGERNLRDPGHVCGTHALILESVQEVPSQVAVVPRRAGGVTQAAQVIRGVLQVRGKSGTRSQQVNSSAAV